MVHKYEVGEDVKYQDQFVTIVAVKNHDEIDRAKGVQPEYTVFDGQKEVLVKEDALTPIEVEVNVEVSNR